MVLFRRHGARDERMHAVSTNDDARVLDDGFSSFAVTANARNAVTVKEQIVDDERLANLGSCF